MTEYRKRFVEEKARLLANGFKILLVTGARQVGKSTLLTHLFPDTPVVLFDPIQDILDARRDPDLFLKNFPPTTILDEVQYVPELLPSLKRFVDRSPQKCQYILTGSQHFSVLKNVSESLAGRVGILHLENMSVYEARRDLSNWAQAFLENPELLIKTFKGLLPGPDLYETLWRGSFPGLLDEPNDLVNGFYQAYVSTYIERDVRLVENVSDLRDYASFMELLAALTAQEINRAELGREIGVSGPTVHRWLQVLHYTYQWREILPYSGNHIKRVSKKRKGYITDTGLACYLQRISSHVALAGHPLLGALFETFCVNLIFKFISGLNYSVNAYHWRTAGGAEVDLILEKDATLYPIEFKCRSYIKPNDLRGLKSFRETYKHKRISPSLVVYAGDRTYWVDEHTLALPWNTTLNN